MTTQADQDVPARFPHAPDAPDRRPRRSEQRRRAQRVHQRAMTAYVAALVLLGLAVPVLGWIGVQVILDSSDGQVVDPQLDPNEPGFQALVAPSPTLLVLHVDDAGGLVGTTLLGLPSEDGDGGGVLLVPPATVGDVPDIGELPIDAAYAYSGLDAARATAEWALGISIDDVVVLDPAEWSDVISSTGPLALTNPDVLRDAEGDVAFPAGELVLEPSQVPAYAAALQPGESRLNRLFRQELVWRAWLDAMAEDPTAVQFPGEQERGLARFLPTIASGTVHLEALPVEPVPVSDPSTPETFVAAPEVLDRVIPEVVPFPASNAGGSRPLVRVLAGTGPQEGTVEVARRVVAAGGQVVLVGNADRFDHAETQITYWDDTRREEAQEVAEALGFGTVTRVDEVDESADIVVVIGQDLAGALGT
ncbi:LCP family protein [Actinomarinicola tropica]|uniref:LytR/CpsA/Psr regulator C-terminal domain-containing protein n=1 Tax=Actinomarinicola tropica TaxID=2789776 RepID=A0A5Q2RMN9_9ACTN|nr:LCP family protein [Actinomarinicola tropica]QGG95686.1 hypothetical protein GH723_11585 [Actinomarinicola tropica]